MTQCEYGTAKSGTKGQERCEEEATETYIQLDEDIYLCEEHSEQFHYSDFLSMR